MACIQADKASSELTNQLQQHAVQASVCRGLEKELANKISELLSLQADRTTLNSKLMASQRQVSMLQDTIAELEADLERLERAGQDLLTYKGKCGAKSLTGM
jgi:chromosome segregation ATPase